MTGTLKLEAEAFGVYVPEKWSSNVHNMPRMRNKATLTALCEQVQAGMDDALIGLTRGASDEFPTLLNQKKVDAQWLFWCRDAAGKAILATFLEKTPLDQAAIFQIAPQDKHVTLALVMRHAGLWVGLHLAPGAVVDRQNLAAKLDKPWERERALAMLSGLPAGTQVGFADEMRDASAVDDAYLQALQRRLSVATPGMGPLQVGCPVSVLDATSMPLDALVQHLRELLLAHVPVYRFVAWSRDNDLIEVGKQIQEVKAQKRRQATAFNTGDRVRFIAGLFSGKQGVVQDVDTKAQVKVRVGKMSVVVPGNDLILVT